MTLRQNNFQPFRVAVTLAALVATIVQLSWEFFNGGVVSHHLLHRADLPAISNWWSLLLLPALTFYLVGRVLRRTTAATERYLQGAIIAQKQTLAIDLQGTPEVQKTTGVGEVAGEHAGAGLGMKAMPAKKMLTAKTAAIAGFAGALLWGIALSLAFVTKHGSVASILFQSIFILVLVLPLYRAEYLLGFVLGMASTFGAVLPTAIGLMVVGLAAIVHLLFYPLLGRAYNRLKAP